MRLAAGGLLAVSAMLTGSSRAGAQDATETRPAVKQTTAVGVDYSYAYFNGSVDRWQLAAFTVTERSSAGSFIAKINYANRFATSGVQVEADAYPHIADGVYAYVNAGYSASSVFPEWRFGGEIFASLPDAYEASLGFRQLRFGGDPVTLFTGSVGKYVGNYWVSLRPYVRSKTTGTSASASITGRRYFEDADHYIGGRVGYGSTPNDQIAPDAVARSNSFSADVHGVRPLATDLVGSWSFGFDREVLSPGRIRTSWTAALGFKVTL